MFLFLIDDLSHPSLYHLLITSQFIDYHHFLENSNIIQILLLSYIMPQIEISGQKLHHILPYIMGFIEIS